MSASPPSLQSTAAAARAHDIVRPVAIVSLLVCVLMLLWFAAQALLMWPLAGTAPWQMLVSLAQENNMPASLQWMLAHPVATSVWLGVICVPSVLASWGLYRQRRWGLWSYVVMLVVSGLANLVIAWWVDAMVGDLVGRVSDPGLYAELHAQRILTALTLYGGSLAVLVLQLWFAWRLLRPDIRARF